MPFDRGPAGWGVDAASVSNPLRWPGGVFYASGRSFTANLSHGGFFRRTRTQWSAKGRPGWVAPPPDTIPAIDESDSIVPGDDSGKDQGDI